MPEEQACCIYNNVLDDNLRQILEEFNLYLKEHKRVVKKVKLSNRYSVIARYG